MSTVGNPHRREMALSLLAALIILIWCGYQVWPIISAPNNLLPAGVDTMGHLTKPFTLSKRWKDLQSSDWFPEWYNGATAVQYYPPLSIWVLTAIEVLANNIFITYKVFSFSCYFVGGYLAWRLARRLGLHPGGALVAGILYTSGFTIHTMWVQVTPGTTLAFPLYPLLIGCLLDYCERPTASSWVKSWAAATAILLTHVMHAYLLFFTTSIFMLVWALITRKPVRVLGMVEVAIASVATTGFWSVPGVTQLENPGIPWSPPEMSEMRTVTVDLLFGPEYSSRVLLGAAALGLLVWALVIRKRTALTWSLTFSFVLTVSVAFGPVNPLYRLLPMGASLAPIRFINAAYLPAALSAGLVADAIVELISQGRSRHLGLTLGVVVAFALVMLNLFVDKRPALPAPSRFMDIDRFFSAIPVTGESMFGSGRVAEELPDVAAQAAFLPVQKGLATTVGWNIEGSVHIYTLHNQNIAYYEDFPEYVLRNWYLWNARSAVIDGRYSLMMEMAQEQGWILRDQDDCYALLTLDSGSSYFMRPNMSAIAIGRSSFYLAGLFPWLAEARDPNPLNYSDQYIDLFSGIILYDLPFLDAQALEQWIVKWVKAGKVVVVDLSVSDSIAELFGVGHEELATRGSLSVQTTQEGTSMYGLLEEIYLKDGRGAAYTGLDQTFLTTDYEGEERAICGTRQLQNGPLYFIGGHLPRLAQPGHRDEARAVWAPILGIITPDTDIVPEPVLVESQDWTPKGTTFQCSFDEDTPTLVSVTYTPRWKATVDGVPVPIYEHENLVLLLVPSGTHEVQLRYLTTYVSTIGWVVSLAAVLWVALRTLLPAQLQVELAERQLKKVAGLWDS